MPSAASITSRLVNATAAMDSGMVLRCLSTYVHGNVTYNEGHRQAAVAAIAEAASALHDDMQVIGGCLCATVHASNSGADAEMPTALFVEAVRPHEGRVSVVRAAARLLRCHAWSPYVNQEQSVVAEACARYAAAHPRDVTVAEWVAHIMIALATSSDHDAYGEHTLRVATITCAVALRGIGEVRIDDKPWSDFVLTEMFPRLRERA